MARTSIRIVSNVDAYVLQLVEGGEVCRIELRHRLAVDPELKRSIRAGLVVLAVVIQRLLSDVEAQRLGLAANRRGRVNERMRDADLAR